MPSDRLPPDRRRPLGDKPDSLIVSDVETPTAAARVVLGTGDAKPDGDGMSIELDLLGGVVVEKPEPPSR